MPVFQGYFTEIANEVPGDCVLESRQEVLDHYVQIVGYIDIQQSSPSLTTMQQ